MLPPRVEESGILYKKTCYCESKENGIAEICEESTNQLIFPGIDRNLNPVEIVQVQDSGPRDVLQHDGTRDREPEGIKQSSRDHQRLRSQATSLPVSQEDATKYCTEKLVESHLGKFCAKLGINVHGFVDICSADIMVSVYSSKS